MAVIQVKASDFTGAQASDEAFGRLVVRGHPAVDGARVLDMLPDELDGLETVEDLIELEYTEPGASSPKTLVVRRGDPAGGSPLPRPRRTGSAHSSTYDACSRCASWRHE